MTALPAYNPTMSLSPVPELVAELAAGRMVILVDEEDRENEGDLVLAADHVSAETINFMARFKSPPNLILPCMKACIPSSSPVKILT